MRSPMFGRFNIPTIAVEENLLFPEYCSLIFFRPVLPHTQTLGMACIHTAKRTPGGVHGGVYMF